MKKKQWEPETLKIWARQYANGTLGGAVLRDTIYLGGSKTVAAVIIREKDYQKLLRLARKTPKRTP